MVRLVRHPQTKGRETDRPNLNHRVTSRLCPISQDETGRLSVRFRPAQDTDIAATSWDKASIEHLSDSSDPPPDGCQCAACVVLDERDHLRQTIESLAGALGDALDRMTAIEGLHDEPGFLRCEKVLAEAKEDTANL